MEREHAAAALAQELLGMKEVAGKVQQRSSKGSDGGANSSNDDGNDIVSP